MNSPKWTWFAIAYQCCLAYAIALMVNQFGGLFTGSFNLVGFILAGIVLAFMIYMLVRPHKEAIKFTKPVKVN